MKILSIESSNILFFKSFLSIPLNLVNHDWKGFVHLCLIISKRAQRCGDLLEPPVIIAYKKPKSPCGVDDDSGIRKHHNICL